MNIFERGFLFLARKNFFNWMPDKPYLKICYKIHTGNKLDLKNPKSFNEKLQWLKLYDRNPLYTKMADKCEAKKYVADIIGEEHIIPILGVWDSVEDIDFDSLPNQFVLKCTHDSGGLVICKDKSQLDIKKAKKKLKYFHNRKYFYLHREWPYKNIKPRIIAEKYMQNGNDSELKDYKFFCFNNVPKLLYISEGLSDHSTAKISFADMDYNMTPFYRSDFEPFKELPEKPVNFEKMKEMAAILSKDISFVRVDFYEINEKIYFGEFTFSPCAGFTPLKPIKYDRIIGDWLKLPHKIV